jgi:hypothetical protein
MKIFKFFILFAFVVIYSNASYCQQQSDTSKVLVTFTEPMSHDGIFDINNYQIYKDGSTPIKIYKVGIAKGDKVIVLFTEKQPPNTSYKIIINNLKDKSGNLISESHKMALY